MDQGSGSFNRSRHNVSRNTMVMRKARDDDARRVAEREGEDSTNVEISSRLTARGAVTGDLDLGDKQQKQGGSPSGKRQVVVRQEGAVSGRLTSTRIAVDNAASIRVTGGDTIIKYKSGDMVIRRGARRANLRKQVLIVYALGYMLLFGLYLYFHITAVATISPRQFLDRAFPRRQSAGIMDLEEAAYRAMRGNRTPAEIRLAQSLSFYDENKDAINIESGNRMTLLNAAKLGHAIIEDEKRSESLREFSKPIKIYRETYLAQLNWPWLLTLYNSIGFFLLLGLFLWRPLMHYLGTQGKKTAAAIQNAHKAQGEAHEYRQKYRDLDVSLEQADQERRAAILERTEKEREAALEQAHSQVEDISGGVESALVNEAGQQAGRISADAAMRACDQAHELLARTLGQDDHDMAINELIADIAGMKSEPKTA